ncbi:MAG: hypothetical protein EPN23_06485 [Verrucomicrobia bacterium]|nr:MAG: hypothetical protein EPN23_06485 [Verrucomicrobiota bacterium]
MSEQEEQQRIAEARGPETPRRQPFKIIELLASMRLAIGLLCVIAMACIIATVLPQGADVTGLLQKNPGAHHWIKRLEAAGLTHVFSAWWFIGLLTALGASLSVCIARRLKALFAAGARPSGSILVFGTLFVHVGILLTLLGGVIKLFWSERGSLQLREGEQTAAFVTDDNRHVQLPYTLQLMKFEIEYYSTAANGKPEETVQAETLVLQGPDSDAGVEWPVEIGAERKVTPPAAATGSHQDWRVTVLRRIPDFMIDTSTHTVQSRSDKMLNPAILVRVAGNGPAAEHWLFARYPDFDMNAMSGQESQPAPFKLRYKVLVSAPEKQHVKSFKSALRVLKGDAVAHEQTIEVNAPMSYEGYSFYQSGYNEDDLSWTALLVVRDPSVPVVYLGFILLGVGAFLTAYWRAEKVKEDSLC